MADSIYFYFIGILVKIPGIYRDTYIKKQNQFSDGFFFPGQTPEAICMFVVFLFIVIYMPSLQDFKR